jgi:hydrogenase maturation protease
MGNQLRAVIIGVGNILLKDEGIGIHVVRELVNIGLPEWISIHECGTSGLNILNYLENTDCAIIVDAVRSGKTPGTVSKFLIDKSRLEEVKDMVSMHQIDLLATLSLGSKMMQLPSRIVIVGVEPRDISPGLSLSSEVNKAIPQIIVKVREEINVVKE